MSSHHVVREKQEPALLVLSLNHFTDEELGQLLEWSPTVIAASHTAEQLAAYGIKIDYVVATDGLPMLQSDVKVIPDNGCSSLQSAMCFLIEQGYPAVNIVCDEFDLANYQTYAEKINLVIFYNQQKIYPVSSGFTKWKPAGERITILSPHNELIEEGLAPLTQNQYQTTHDGFFKLWFSEPFVFIAEEY